MTRPRTERWSRVCHAAKEIEICGKTRRHKPDLEARLRLVELLPQVQEKLGTIPGIEMFPVMPPALPGGGQFPVEIVLLSTEEPERMLGSVTAGLFRGGRERMPGLSTPEVLTQGRGKLLRKLASWPARRDAQGDRPRRHGLRMAAGGSAAPPSATMPAWPTPRSTCAPR